MDRERRRGVAAPGKGAVVRVGCVSVRRFGTAKAHGLMAPNRVAAQGMEPGGESGRRLSVFIKGSEERE